MRHWARIVSIAALSLGASSVAACGSGGGSEQVAGSGSISITSFSPALLAGCAPTAFTITGTGFQDVSGSTAIVRFTATTGVPFGGSAVATVIGVITSSTTITGVTPEVTLCGVASISVTVDVTLESGVSTSTTGSGITITSSAPTLTTFSPNPVPAAIPTAFSIVGTGFTPGPVTVRFVSATPGDLNFVNGTQDSVDIAATATATTVTGETPVARACTASFTSSVQVIEPDGCCTAPTVNTFLTWLAPTITTGGIGVNGVLQNSQLMAGTNLGVAGEIGTVRLTGSAAIFNGGSTNTVDVPGTVGAGGTSFTFLTPIAAVCPAPAAIASYQWIAPRGGSCATGGPITFNIPTLGGSVTQNALDPLATVLIYGAVLPPVGSLLNLRFTSTSAGVPSIFADGTSSYIDVTATVTSPTLVSFQGPRATLCGIDSATASVTTYFPGGSCFVTIPTFWTFNGPALTAVSPGGIQNANVPAALFPNNNLFSIAGGDPFTINAASGRSFGTVGSFVEVRFAAVAAGSAVFQGGAQSYDTVVGRIETSTTISGVSPATILPLNAAPLAATAQVFFSDGSCSPTTPVVFDGTTDRAFTNGAGGVFAIVENGAGVPTAITGSPFPSAGGGLSVDGRKNRLAIRGTSGSGLFIADTAPTMNATPAIPATFGSSVGAGGINTPPNVIDNVIAPDVHTVWGTDGGANQLFSFDENTRSSAGGILFVSDTAVPGASSPQRLFYNQPSQELVVQFAATSQIALINASTGVINAIFAIPAVVNGGAPPLGAATWNGVMGIRPGGAGTARAYLVYNDPVATNFDNIGTLAFSTGVITTTLTAGVNQVDTTFINSFTFDAVRDQLVWWHNTPATIERRNATTLAAIASLATAAGSNFGNLAANPFTDRYFAHDIVNGTFVSINGSTLAAVGTVAVGTVATANLAFVASTSP